MGQNEITRTMVNNLMKKELQTDPQPPPLFANLPKNTQINSLTADENTPNLLDSGKYVSLNGRIVKRLNWDSIASPVEAKRKFVLNHIERNPVDIRDIRQYDNLIRTRNFSGFLNKASLDASKSQGKSLQEIAKNSEESKRYLQSLRDRIKNIENEIQKRQVQQGPQSTKPPDLSGLPQPVDPLNTTNLQDLVEKDLSAKLNFIQLDAMTRNTDIQSIDEKLMDFYTAVLQNKPEDETKKIYEELEFLVNERYAELDQDIQALDTMDQETAEELEAGPSRRLLEEGGPTTQAEPVKQEGEEIITPKTGELYNAQQFEPLQLREFIGQKVRYTTGEGIISAVDRSSRNNTVVRVKDNQGNIHNVKVFTIL